MYLNPCSLRSLFASLLKIMTGVNLQPAGRLPAWQVSLDGKDYSEDLHSLFSHKCLFERSF